MFQQLYETKSIRKTEATQTRANVDI